MGDIPDWVEGDEEYKPYVPSWNYPKGKPKMCFCGCHEGYHGSDRVCVRSQFCGCVGLPDCCFTTDDEFTAAQLPLPGGKPVAESE